MAEEKKIDDDGEIVIKVRDMRKLGWFLAIFGAITVLVGFAPWEAGRLDPHSPSIIFGSISFGIGGWLLT